MKHSLLTVCKIALEHTVYTDGRPQLRVQGSDDRPTTLYNHTTMTKCAVLIHYGRK